MKTGLAVANLCDTCKDTFAECKGEIIVWGEDVEMAFTEITISKRYNDAVVVCRNYARTESEGV